jgi:tRNA (guanine37-N1)-methyltransferase
MRIDLLTLFPAMADGFLRESVVGRAVEKQLLRFEAHDIRRWTTDKHQRVDDTPFGGGPGMLMACQPLFAAVDAVATPGCEVIYLSPDGETLSPKLARELALKPHLVLVSGHYEGVDERFRQVRGCLHVFLFYGLIHAADISFPWLAKDYSTEIDFRFAAVAIR